MSDALSRRLDNEAPLPRGPRRPSDDSLTVVTGDGPSAGRTVVSPDRTWTVGRSDDADIVVVDERVSRRHLVLEHGEHDWQVRDVSSNGTWQAETRLGRAGTRIPRGGAVRLRLGDRGGPEIVLEGPASPAERQTVLVPDPAQLAAHDDAPPPAGYSPATAAFGAAGYGAAAHGVPPPAGGPPAGSAPGGSAPPGTAATPRRRRRRRRLLIVVLVLIVLLAIADRVAAKIASTEAVSQIVQQSQGLATKPTVSFGGFPFLTQVIFGKYTDISVGIDGITPPGSVRIQRISGHLLGAHVPLSTVIEGDVSKIPVDHVTATLAFRFVDLNAFLKNQPGHLRLSWNKGAVQVSGSFVEAGETIKVSGSTTLGVADGGLVITPKSLHVAAGGALGQLGDLGSLLGGAVSAFPPVPVPMPDLPFHLRLTAVHSDATGLSASAAADGLVLDASQK